MSDDDGHGHPFRPAFVELGESLFDVVKALGEAAVAKATSPPVRTAPSRLSTLEVLEFLGKRLTEGGHTEVSWWRSAIRDSVEFRIRCTTCDHTDYSARGEIDGKALMLYAWNKRQFFDIVCEKLFANFVPHPHLVIER